MVGEPPRQKKKAPFYGGFFWAAYTLHLKGPLKKEALYYERKIHDVIMLVILADQPLSSDGPAESIQTSNSSTV